MRNDKRNNKENYPTDQIELHKMRLSNIHVCRYYTEEILFHVAYIPLPLKKFRIIADVE